MGQPVEDLLSTGDAAIATLVALLVAVVAVLAAVVVALAPRTAARCTTPASSRARSAILRSEVTGRVLEVAVRRGRHRARRTRSSRASPTTTCGAASPRSASRSPSQEADIRRQEEQVRLVESTWKTQRRRAARRAPPGRGRRRRSPTRTLERERSLVQTGASTAQLLDEARAARDQATQRRRPRARHAGPRGRRRRARSRSRAISSTCCARSASSPPPSSPSSR